MNRSATLYVHAHAICFGLALVLATAGAVPAPAAAPIGHDETDAPTIDERFERIGERVPEFGGLYVDEAERTLVVQVTEERPGLKADLRHAIRAELGDVFAENDLPRRIRLAPAQFAFAQLKRWHDRSAEVLNIPGVVLTDIDERANRLTVGVEDEDLRDAVQASLDAAAIPPEGWQVEEVNPVDPLNLRARHRPLVGGLEIGLGGTCTLGFPAIRNGILGFVTNSHCTRTQGGVEGTTYSQPAGDLEIVGDETVDPAYVAGTLGCPTGSRCRRSDSAFVRTRSKVGISVSGIALPPALGSLSWNGVDRATIFSEGSPVLGITVYKVGRTTGITSGTVTRTCTTYTQNTVQRFVIVCQHEANLGMQPGDSGSPVFRPAFAREACGSPLGVLGCVQLLGVAWGGGGVWSPIGNVQGSAELGPLTTCAFGAC
jgi:hypothetical protein